MSATITTEQVLEKLKEVYDPEIPVNIYELGLIYEIAVDADVLKAAEKSGGQHHDHASADKPRAPADT